MDVHNATATISLDAHKPEKRGTLWKRTLEFCMTINLLAKNWLILP
jgi:hypothetical protein